jgi:hypothetical protein
MKKNTTLRIAVYHEKIKNTNEKTRTLSSTRASIPAKRSKTSPPLISKPLLAPSKRKTK